MITRQLETLLHRTTITAHILQLHSLFLKTALLQDSYCVSQFIHHAASVSVPLARSLFDDLPNTPPLFAWNSLIRAYTRTPSPIESVKMFALMLRVGLKADKFSFPFVVKACGHCLLIGEGGGMHSLILRLGFGGDKYIGNTLLRMYAAFDDMDLARKVFDEMTNRDVVSWSSMIAACVACDRALDAFQVFQDMKLANEKPNHVTLVSMLSACSNLFNIRAGRSVHAYIVVTDMELDAALGTSLLEMYSKCGHIEEAFRVFNQTVEKNLQSWTVMLSGLADHGRGKDAIYLFHEMQKTGLKPDSVSFSAIFSACSHLGLVDRGREYFEQMEAVYGISPTIEHYGCMVDLLGRAGLIEEALGLIKKMPMEPNSIILRTLIGACTNHGQALHLDDSMRKLLLKLEPDLGANYVLTANLSSLSCSWKDAADLRSVMKTHGLKKSAGRSWL